MLILTDHLNLRFGEEPLYGYSVTVPDGVTTLWGGIEDGINFDNTGGCSFTVRISEVCN